MRITGDIIAGIRIGTPYLWYYILRNTIKSRRK